MEAAHPRTKKIIKKKRNFIHEKSCSCSSSFFDNDLNTFTQQILFIAILFEQIQRRGNNNKYEDIRKFPATLNFFAN
jgi:hypothetical protein